MLEISGNEIKTIIIVTHKTHNVQMENSLALTQSKMEEFSMCDKPESGNFPSEIAFSCTHTETFVGQKIIIEGRKIFSPAFRVDCVLVIYGENCESAQLLLVKK